MLLRRTLIALSLLTVGTPTIANDIYLADLKPRKAYVTINNVKNITARTGYDNQPNFSLDGKGLFYTAMIGDKDNQQADIFFYDFAKKQAQNITNSKTTSEYSPTPMGTDKKLSVIKVETDGTQRLWQITTATGKQKILNKTIKPVGYHSWGENKDLVLFVLGSPMTLQHINKIDSMSGSVKANDVGRSLRYNDLLKSFSFTQGKQQQVFSTYNANTDTVTKHLPLPGNAQYYTWLNDKQVISADGNQLYVWNYTTASQSSNDWLPLADLSSYCDGNVTRLAVNKLMTQLAFVCDKDAK